MAFKPHIPRTQKGFTLIECMISMVILTIGLLAVGFVAHKRRVRALARQPEESQL